MAEKKKEEKKNTLRVLAFNIGGALLVYFLFILIGSLILKAYTRHAETIVVPDVHGINVKQATSKLESYNLDLQISDSAYSDKFPPYFILDQNPKVNSKVKEGRIIYVTINQKYPPKVKMPELRDASLKQAGLVLESFGLKVGRLIYKPDLAKNAVLDQLYENHSVKPGTLIMKGSNIDLVLGNGLSDTTIVVPDLIGLSISEAKFVLDGSSLNIGAVIPDNTIYGDTSQAVIYRQIPSSEPPDNKLNIGGSVDIFISNDRNKKIEEKISDNDL